MKEKNKKGRLLMCIVSKLYYLTILFMMGLVEPILTAPWPRLMYVAYVKVAPPPAPAKT